MAIGFTTFSEYVDGLLPSDWLNALGDGNDFTKETDVAFVDDSYLDKPQVTKFSLAGPILGISGSATAMEIVARFRFHNAIGTEEIVFCLNQVVGGTGGDGFPDLYCAIFPGSPTGSLQFVHNVTPIDVKEIPFPLLENLFYHVRARWEVANGLVFAKVWASGDSEPGPWLIDGAAYTDPGDRGPVGFGGQWFNQNDLDTFGWATNGETAPTSAEVEGQVQIAASMEAIFGGEVQFAASIETTIRSEPDRFSPGVHFDGLNPRFYRGSSFQRRDS